MLILKCDAEKRLQPLQPASVTCLARMRLLNTLSALADLSSEDSISHNLGPKYRSVYRTLQYYT